MFESEEFYLNEIEKYKKLIYHQDLLIYLSKKGFQAAKVKLGQCKQELVLSVAIDYLGEGLSFMDLINSANVGLMKGIEEINTCDDNNLDDFLTRYIKQSIQEAISNTKI